MKRSFQLALNAAARYCLYKSFLRRRNPVKKNRVARTSVLSFSALVVIAIVLAPVLFSQEKKEPAASVHKIVHFGDLKWTPIIKGCDMAPVDGDPNSDSAPFVIRLRCADGAKIPAHWHPTDENVTVLKGTFLVGMGDTLDESKLQTMNVGNFISVPKEMHHYAMSKGETIVQVHGAGPFKVNWVNPSEVQPPDSAPAAKP
jgi:ChrR Cupin-like domain